MMQTIVLISIVFVACFYFRCGKKTPNPTLAKNQLMNGFYVKHDTLFFHEKELKQVDLPSFSIIDESYAKDKHHVYFYATERQSKDYFTTRKLIFETVALSQPSEFIALGYGYGKDGQHAFKEGVPFPVQELQTLEALTFHWVKDKKAVYLDGVLIPGLDGASFELLSNAYALDKNDVFFLEGMFDGHPQITPFCPKPSSFQMLAFPYSKDDESIYYRDKKLEANAPHFQIIGHGYSRDDDHVFFQDQKMNGIDITSFTVYQENENFTGEGAYAKDKNHVFYQHKIIEQADPVSLVVLHEKYSKDTQNVYYTSKIIRGADPSSFSVFPHDMGDSDAKDKHSYYHQGQRVRNPE